MAREHTGRIARLARRRRDDHDSARYERSQKDACVDDHLSHQDRQADQTRADQRKEYGSSKCTARPVALRLRRVLGRAGGYVACPRPTVSIMITLAEQALLPLSDATHSRPVSVVWPNRPPFPRLSPACPPAPPARDSAN